MEPIILVGAGGHCIACIDILRLENKYEIIGILDKKEKLGGNVLGIPIIGTDSDIPGLTAKCNNFLISVGQIKSSAIRCNIYYQIKRSGGKLPVIISPRAYVSPLSIIREGTIVMHNALINAGASVGKNCIINTGALIEHEAVIEDFCHISTQAVVNGQARIAENSFLGSNCVIANNVSIPANAIIGAGACVINTEMQSGTYVGNPARKNEK